MYLFVVLVLTVLSVVEVAQPAFAKKYKVLIAFFAFMLFVFHDGFRWETGCDWVPYFNFFDTLPWVAWEDTYFEPGFFFFSYVIRSVTDNYTVYLVLHALIFYGAAFYAIYKLSPYPTISLLLLYMITVPLMGTNRQLMATAIYLAALVVLIRRQYGLYVVLILFAMTFHQTAVVALILPFFGRKVNNIILAAGLLLCLAISLSGVLNTLAPAMAVLSQSEGNANRLDVYTSSTYELSPLMILLSLVRKLLWVVLLVIYERRAKPKNRSFYMFFNMYVLSVYIYVAFNGTPFQIFVGRLGLYFSLAEMFVVPYVIILFRGALVRVGLVLLLAAYAWLSITRSFSNYGEGNDIFEPYKSLFMNTNYVRIDE